MVQRTEDIVADHTMTAAITTGDIGQSDQIDIIEPKQLTAPLTEMYQLRVGIDVGMAFTEMLSGTYRRTPFKQKKPTTSLPYVGYFSPRSSPRIDPQYEFFLRYNEKPAFSIYNPKGYSITPILHFVGKKLVLVPLDPSPEMGSAGAKPADNKKAAEILHLQPAKLEAIANAVLNQAIPHRRITAYGIDE